MAVKNPFQDNPHCAVWHGLHHLDERYRKKYGMSMIRNLAAIAELGIRAFGRTEREHWTCTACGATINVHTTGNVRLVGMSGSKTGITY